MENFRYRKFLLNGEINPETTGRIIDAIHDVEYEDKITLKKMKAQFVELGINKDIESPHIELMIDSFGGSVYDAIALYEVIRASSVPVDTIAVGACMSAAVIIYLAGNKRYVGANSYFMIHDISTMLYGKGKDIEQDIEQIKRLRDTMMQVISINTKIPKDILDDIIENKKDLYIDSSKAIEYGFANGYYYPMGGE